jgi:hypothetical protein
MSALPTTGNPYNFSIRYGTQGESGVKEMKSAQFYPSAEIAARHMRLEQIALVRRSCIVLSAHVFEDHPYVAR